MQTPQMKLAVTMRLNPPKHKKCTALSDCGAQNGGGRDFKWKRCILRMQMYFRMRKPQVMQSKPQTESSVPARWHDCLRPPTTQKVSMGPAM